ncbi:MAG: nifU, partial [Francisellaceae bacterium]|nr:nifU [Francisellaceae bacterium]
MSINDLYQELIIDHATKPRNCGEILDTDTYAEGFNPLCGDKLKIFIKLQDNKVIDFKFLGIGCAISQASASLMSEVLQNKNLQEVEFIKSEFLNML